MTDFNRTPRFQNPEFTKLGRRIDDIAAMLNGIKTRLEDLERRLDGAAYVTQSNNERLNINDARRNQEGQVPASAVQTDARAAERSDVGTEVPLPPVRTTVSTIERLERQGVHSLPGPRPSVLPDQGSE
jgi:hypothetical protein